MTNYTKSGRRIYVASSWRNKYQPDVVETLRNKNHEVYDFRHPRPGYDGFHWSEIDVDWENWTPDQYLAALAHSHSKAGFDSDFRAMQWANTCVLVLPCGRSAHLEAGWFAGQNKRLIIYIPERIEPDLMYLMADRVCLNMSAVLAEL